MFAMSVPVTSWDVVMAVVGAVGFGLLVSFSATRGLRRYVTAVQSGAAELSMIRFSDVLQVGAPATDAWHSLISATAGTLDQLDVRLVASGSEQRPVVARRSIGPDGCAADSSTVVVPHGGALVAFGDPRLAQELLVTPRDGFGVVEVQREVLLAFADQVGLMARIGLLSELR